MISEQEYQNIFDDIKKTLILIGYDVVYNPKLGKYLSWRQDTDPIITCRDLRLLFKSKGYVWQNKQSHHFDLTLLYFLNLETLKNRLTKL